MRWEKISKIFDPSAAPWISSHAQVPTVLVMQDSLRVYFAGRNEKGKSFPVVVDLEKREPFHVLQIASSPCLEFGKPGTFDEDGMMPSEIVISDGKILMYYTGWNQKVTTPYHNTIGLAESVDGGLHFNRIFDGPLLGRTPAEPYVVVTPCIIRDSGIWHMWYISGLRWVEIAEKYEPIYVIKYARSSDGIIWERLNQVIISQKSEFEAFSRPTVIKIDGKFHMWYCYRECIDYRDGAGSYQIGYASSLDGTQWDRRDEESGISKSDSGWDSTMICYPYVVAIDSQYYLFYNGNSFGREGFGCAKLVDIN